MAARAGQLVWLSGGIGELRIYASSGLEVRHAPGAPVAPREFTSKLREAVTDGASAYYGVWIDIYEWLGAPLPKPPRPRDLVRMADVLVEAFERGRLVAFRRPAERFLLLDGAPDTQRKGPRERPVGEEPGTTWFSLRVVDEAGEALDGLEVKFDVLGEQRDAKTNAAGAAKIDTLSTGFASARLQDLDKVRAKLRPRWEEAREAKTLDGLKVVREIGEGVLESISLECEKVTTLVITPAAWIGIQLVDEDGAPVGGRPYRIVTPSGETLDGVLDAEGWARHAGLTPGSCKVFCPYVAARAEVTHDVEAGEHISGVAQRYGFDDYKPVWEYAGNAELRALRPNPNELMAGDAVVIPAIEAKPEARMTGLHHVFTVKRSPLDVRLKLLRWQMKPEAERLCVLLDAIRSTTPDGIVQASVEKTARAAALDLHGARTSLAIGYLTPPDDDSDSGWKARLYNLGFLFDRENDDDGENLRFALEDFQAEYRLALSGEFDDATKAKLEEVYGC